MPARGLSSGDLLSLTEAAGALRVREASGIAWLRERGLVRTVAGRELVIWGDVLAAIRAGDELVAPQPRATPRGTLRRAKTL